MSQSQCSGGSQDGHNDQNEAAAYMHSNPFHMDENVARVMPLNPNWMLRANNNRLNTIRISLTYRNVCISQVRPRILLRLCPQAQTLLRMKTPVAVTVLRPHRQTTRTAIQIMAPKRLTSGARRKPAYWSTSGKKESTSWKVRWQRKLGTKLSEPCAKLERQELQSSARTKSEI
jgi:hypothetical protein